MSLLQRRGERRATINEELWGQVDDDDGVVRFLPPHALTAEIFAVATGAKRDSLMSSVYGGLYEFDVKFKSNEYSECNDRLSPVILAHK